jgi:hypothetical protein
MPSPFPGMNPYFEQPGLWRGFHTSLIVKMLDALGPAAAPRYLVNVEESLYIEQPPGERGELFAVADNAISRNEDAPTAGGAATLAAPTIAPVTARVRLGAITRKHRWLTVRDSHDRRVVAVIELLSPSNKSPGDDRAQYLRQRRRILRSAAHLVEIDLLRGGQRMPVDDAPPSDYRVMVSRRPQRPEVQVWPVGVRQPLPTVPIPLRTGEPELALDLKPLIDAVHDGGTYRYQLYAGVPSPPLSPDDAAWAADIARAATP